MAFISRRRYIYILMILLLLFVVLGEEETDRLVWVRAGHAGGE